MAIKQKKFYEMYLVVEGSGEFPLDMCRYDRAFPAQEQDSSSAQNRSGLRRIVLCRRSVNLQPTYGRWLSFGWKVLAESEDLYQMQEIQKQVESAA